MISSIAILLLFVATLLYISGLAKSRSRQLFITGFILLLTAPVITGRLNFLVSNQKVIWQIVGALLGLILLYSIGAGWIRYKKHNQKTSVPVSLKRRIDR